MKETVSQEYERSVAALEAAIRRCSAVSNACAGIRSPTSAHYYASVLFTTLCVRGMSLAILIPHSPWATKECDHWDFGSAAGIVRSILEVRLAFFYLCIEEVARQEWECRWNLFNLHDCTTRIHLFDELQSDIVDSLKAQADELRQRLSKNQHFLSLQTRDRNRLNTGANAYLVPLENIAIRCGMDVATFRVLYRFYSVQLHGLPVSFYRTGDKNRGRGIRNNVDEGYLTTCVALASELLTAACDEMERLSATSQSKKVQKSD